ncbi:A disintegrin and metalloproteinase with thrombospondin motifs 14-like [Antechinus flavipes]|uniref:A disintegrin and metalloproteinase with thrombospondin motifs 14-like n=1 Tax=Antechinus flavipes TaxID=38775 RepID=UPI002235ECAF|nr:A disintegrin and metalloproteinase with thrombospondin motifs 14-like [Antechinus flavipes]
MEAKELSLAVLTAPECWRHCSACCLGQWPDAGGCDPRLTAGREQLLLSGKLSDYGVFVPFSADPHGRFLSHVVSGPAASRSGAFGRPPPSPATPSSRHRVARSPAVAAGEPAGPRPAGKYSIYFNVTIFGKEFHLGLKPKQRLVAPGAFAQWQEDFWELSRQPLQQDCVFTGSITGMPGTAVAISNCDGLAGLIRTDSSEYFIEPLERGQQAKEETGRAHIVYSRAAIRLEKAEPQGDLHNEVIGQVLAPVELGQEVSLGQKKV